jgi:hypothetical protein
MPDDSSGPRACSDVNHSEVCSPELNDLLDGEVIEERSMVVQLCSMMAAEGVTLACSRCSSVDEPIAAIVIIESVERAWLACAECWRKLPRTRLAD